MNNYIQMIKEGEKCYGNYFPNGEVCSYKIKNTFIPIGNDNFNIIKVYLESHNIDEIIDLKWVQEIKNENGFLYYNTNLGSFIDSDNKLTQKIKEMIKDKTISIKNQEKYISTDEVEVNVFLPVCFSLSKITPAKSINSYILDSEYLELPFKLNMEIIKNIEEDFFNNNLIIQTHFIKNTKGNILRFKIDKKTIVKLYKWSKQYTGDTLKEELEFDYKLFKRAKSKGPRYQWCYENYQEFLWAPIIFATNKIIYMINNQARKKTMGLLTKDKMGDMVCIKKIYSNSTSSVSPFFSLRDEQITIYPQELNWEHKPLDIAIQRIRFLFDQGLYFESIVVTQAVIESIISGMFENNARELKWGEQHGALRKYFNPTFHNDSKLKELLNGGLQKIYKYRNDFAHDYLEHEPKYIFDLKKYQEIEELLKPFIDVFENMNFLREVDQMYSKRESFIQDFSSSKITNSKFSHCLNLLNTLLKKCKK